MTSNKQSNNTIINQEVSDEFPQKLKEPKKFGFKDTQTMTSNKQDNNTPKMGAMLDANGEPIHFKYYLFAVRFGYGSGLQHAIQQDTAALEFCKYVVDKYPNWDTDKSWEQEFLDEAEKREEEAAPKKKKTRRGGKKKKSKATQVQDKTSSITEVSLRYKNFIETKYDQALIHSAVSAKEAWEREKAAAPAIAWEEQPQTKWVRKFSTDFVNDRFKSIKIHDAVKVPITPIALNNHCHHNAKFYSQHLKDCEAVFGYNVFACKCGKRIECEAHSVNKVKGEYIDFTEDYDGETNKWFIPINTNGQTISNDAITLKNDARDGYRHIDTLHSNRGCKCKAYKHSKMTDYGKTPIDQKLVESIISFWEQ